MLKLSVSTSLTRCLKFPFADIPCPDTWSSFNIPDQTNCYYIGDTLGTYIEAKAQCKAVGYPMTTELVAINSVDELVGSV